LVLKLIRFAPKNWVLENCVDLSPNEAARRIKQHWVVFTLLLTVTLSMMVVLAARTLVDIFFDSELPGVVLRLFVPLEQVAQMPVFSHLWALAPAAVATDPAPYLLSPYVFSMMVLAFFTIRERSILVTLGRAMREIRIVPFGGDRIGNVSAGGNLTINQCVADKPSQRPLMSLVLPALVSGIVSGLFKLLQTQLGY
jgi:hypothetical protein